MRLDDSSRRWSLALSLALSSNTPELDKACARLRPRGALDLAAEVQARDIGLVVMAGRINDSVGGGPPAGNMLLNFLLCAGAYRARGHDAHAVSSDCQVE
jgi:hypothetical protein